MTETPWLWATPCDYTIFPVLIHHNCCGVGIFLFVLDMMIFARGWFNHLSSTICTTCIDVHIHICKYVETSDMAGISVDYLNLFKPLLMHVTNYPETSRFLLLLAMLFLYGNDQLIPRSHTAPLGTTDM